MKNRILSFLVILCCATGLQAQSFHLVDTMRTTLGSTSDFSLTNPIQIVNDAGVDLPIFWHRFEESLPSAWDVSSCTPMGCMPIGVDSGSYTLDPVNHNCHFYPNGTVGSGHARILIRNVSTGEEVIASWYADVNATSIGELVMSSYTVLNASDGSVQILFDSVQEDLGMELFTASGKLIRSEMLNGANSFVLSGLNPGVVILRMIAKNGSISTQRIGIQ